VAFSVYLAWYYLLGLPFSREYKRGIADQRNHLPPREHVDLYGEIEEKTIAELVVQHPVTFFHFCCCYTSRVADTFYAARLTTFWGAFFSMLFLQPICPCYLPLMRSGVREYLNGESCTMADLLVFLVPCTHCILCYGFREAVAIDEATGVVPRVPFELGLVTDVYQSSPALFEWPQWIKDWRWKTKESRVKVKYVGDPIEINDDGTKRQRMHHSMRSDEDLDRSRSFASSPKRKHTKNNYDMSFKTGGKSARKKSHKKTHARDDDPLDIFQGANATASWESKMTAVRDAHMAFKPVNRPRCFDFMETGMCKNGYRCWWLHITNEIAPKELTTRDETKNKVLNCPGKHGVVDVEVGPSYQCNLCQKKLFELDRGYACKQCNFTACSDCAKGFKSVILLEEVD